MRQYQTTSMIELHCGEIGLADHQSELRRSRVRRIDGCRHEILQTIQIKAGEFVGLDEVPRGLEGALVEIVQPASPELCEEAPVAVKSIAPKTVTEETPVPDPNKRKGYRRG